MLNQNNSNDIITVKDLSTATRRLISRYLTGEITPLDINETTDLSEQLKREELWEEKIRKIDNLNELIGEKIKEFKLIVGQAYEFYNLIGEDDRNSLKCSK